MMLELSDCFDGKVALVTGAASGLGRGTAERLAQHGASVVLFDRNSAGLAETARAHAADGIRVNCVCPGSIRTPMLEDTFAAAGPELRAQRETEFRARHPLGRFGEVDEVVSAVLFLLGPGASFITGTALPVDGGRLA